MGKYIIIDGKEYKVAITKLQRKGDILDKFAYRSEDGELHREVIGTFYNYSLTLGTINDTKLYDELFEVLTEPVASHKVEMPNDHVEFEGYFSSVQDEVDRVFDDRTRYKGLTANFTAMRPRKRAK